MQGERSDVTDAVLCLNIGSLPGVLPVHSQWMYGHSHPQQLPPTQMTPQSSSQFAVHPYTQMPPQPYGPSSTPQPQPYFLPPPHSHQPHSISHHEHQPDVHGWPPYPYGQPFCGPQPSAALSHMEGEFIEIMSLLPRPSYIINKWSHGHAGTKSKAVYVLI